MSLQPLAWSEPRPTGWATIEARDGVSEWRITPVPRDVARIHYSGVDADGTIVGGTEHAASAESADEARIVIDALRAGTDHLPGWREQLEAAGFVRSYPDHADGKGLSGLWHDVRRSGLFQICVHDAYTRPNQEPETSVHATYESDRATFWHNVCSVDGNAARKRDYGAMRIRSGLPKGIDALKAGVAAALAIRDARTLRGGRFATPLGGPTKEAKAK